MRILTILLLFSSLAFPKADYELIKEFVGTYPLVELNGSSNLGGVAEIVAFDGGVGLTIMPLEKSSRPAPVIKIITGKESTELTKEPDRLVQTYRMADETVRIDYLIKDGYLEILTEDCKITGCDRVRAILSRGKATGKLVSAWEFFEKRRGEYLISIAGGIVPDPADNLAIIEPSGTENEEMFTLPFCQPEGCDPGWFYFPYGSTFVYETTDSVSGATIFTILNTKSKLKRFTWEESAKGVVFTNYQYKLISGGVVALEHVMKKP